MNPSPQILVAYASTHGQTEKIALRLAESIRAEGVDAVVFRADGSRDIDPEPFAAVVACGHCTSASIRKP